jgi:hypothetical protein
MKAARGTPAAGNSRGIPQALSHTCILSLASPLFVADANPLCAGMIFGGNKLGRCVGRRPSVAVEQHDLGQIAPFHLAPVRASRRCEPPGDLAAAQVAGQVLGLLAVRPLDPEEADGLAIDTKGAGVNHFRHAVDRA